MRSGGNFSPEWSHLAPAPSYLRIVVVATTVGVTAGAAVVLSLIDHPTAEVSTTTAAAHAIVTIPRAVAKSSTAAKDAVTPVKVAAPVATQSSVTAPAVQNPAPQNIAAQTPAVLTPAIPAPATQPQMRAQIQPAATAAVAPSVVSLSEGNPVTATPEPTDETVVVPGVAQAKKKHAGAGKNRQAQAPDLGGMLRHLFTTRSSSGR
jgi:hypothetical protein